MLLPILFSVSSSADVPDSLVNIPAKIW
jgi:hypothetical protein